MIPSALTAYSSKGGVGKSSLTTNIAVTAAIAGWRVLTVDLDPQGNLADGLGYDTHDDYDGGASLTRAIWDPQQLLVMRGVRPNLDCVPGGPLSEQLADHIASSYAHNPGEAPFVFDRMLAPIADDYDLILFDLPPTPSAMHSAALTTVRFIVIVTATDKFSRGGLASGFRRYDQVRRSSNPDLEVLAAVITRHDLRYPRHLELALEELRGVFGDAVPVLDPPIRHNQGADSDMKEAGIGAAEYEVAARRAKRERLQWLKARKKDPGGAGEAPASVSSVAGALAQDYDAVIGQIIDMVRQRSLAVDHADQQAATAAEGS